MATEDKATGLHELVQLDNGNWVDPAAITSISYLEAFDQHPHRVVVWHGRDPALSEVNPFETADRATTYRATLGMAVNRARRPPMTDGETPP